MGREYLVRPLFMALPILRIREKDLFDSNRSNLGGRNAGFCNVGNILLFRRETIFAAKISV